MPRMPRPAVTLGYVLLFAAAIVVGAELARPFGTASVAFDSQVAVLYFDRIAAGTRLEGFITTNPKPLLTVVFGLLHALFNDWRPLAWATLLANGLAIALAAALVHRIGGAAAAAFAGLALVVNASLLNDVGFALATPFAFVGWALAGLAITAPRPRYALAGAALAAATLARVETLVIIGTAVVALVWVTWAPPRFRIVAAPRAAWLVPGIGLLALPVMLVHDWLLTGDPLYWAGVASRFAAGTQGHVPTPLDIVRSLALRYWDMGALTALAVLGAVRLALDRRFELLVGLAGLGPGVAAFLVFLAFRGIVVPLRYVAPVDVAVIGAASLGLGTLTVGLLARPELATWLARLRGRGAVPGVAVAAVVAVLLSGPYWQTNTTIRTDVRTSLALAAAADAAVPVVRAELAAHGSDLTGAPRVLVATAIRPRLVVDLGLTNSSVGGIVASEIDVAGGFPRPGQVIVHSRAGDSPAPGWADLEIEAPRTIGSVTLVPLLADPTAGLWVIAVR